MSMSPVTTRPTTDGPPTGVHPLSHAAGEANGPPAADFVRLLPEIERHARVAHRRLRGEERDEAVQDAVCQAYLAYVRLAARGRTAAAPAVSLARYAAAQYRAGRRAGCRLNANDVTSERCRRRRGVTVERLDRPDGRGDWRDVLVEDRTVSPADLAASRIDYPEFLSSLTPRHRAVAERLAAGDRPGAVAERFGVSPGRVAQLRRQLHRAWLEFHGLEAPACVA